MISVILPTYNRAGKIMLSIESVLSQEFKEFELIIVDDASVDDTYDIVNKISDKRVVYIRHKENKGASVARNTGWRNSKYEYLAFIDSDDVWDSKYLLSQIEKYKYTDEGVGLIYCRYINVYKNKKIIKPENIKIKSNSSIMEAIVVNPFITPQIILVRKSVMASLNGFDENLKSLEDFDFSLRLLQKYKIIRNDDILVEIRLSNDSLSLQHEKNIVSSKQIYNKNVSLFDDIRLKRKYIYSVLRDYYKNTKKIDMYFVSELRKSGNMNMYILKFYLYCLYIRFFE